MPGFTMSYGQKKWRLHNKLGFTWQLSGFCPALRFPAPDFRNHTKGVNESWSSLSQQQNSSRTKFKTPTLAFASTLAWLRNSSRMMSIWFARAAMWRVVSPRSVGFSMFAPFSKSKVITWGCPRNAATCNGVKPD